MSDIFFYNDTATTDIYTYLHTLSLHDALPVSVTMRPPGPVPVSVLRSMPCSAARRLASGLALMRSPLSVCPELVEGPSFFATVAEEEDGASTGSARTGSEAGADRKSVV